MKYIWSPEDIIPGRFVCKPDMGTPKPNPGWDAKWTHKIGFRSDCSDHELTVKRNLVLIAVATDGMVGEPKTAAEVAQWLNDEMMIPMPHRRLIETMNYMRGHYDDQ